jgi:hypothetical protein
MLDSSSVSSLRRALPRVPHQSFSLQDIGDDELRASVLLCVSKCGRFLFAYRCSFVTDGVQPGQCYALSVWQLNGRERATRICAVPLFGSSIEAPLFESAMLQITLVLTADQCVACVYGQPPNPAHSVTSKLCHLSLIPLPFCALTRERALSPDDVCLGTVNLRFFVAPPYPGIVPGASAWSSDATAMRFTVLLHCGACVRQVTFRVVVSPLGASQSTGSTSYDIPPTATVPATGATPSTQLVSDEPSVSSSSSSSSNNSTTVATGDDDVFKYPRAPEELLRDFSCAGFDSSLDDAMEWLSWSIDNVVDARVSRRLGMASVRRVSIRLERTTLVFDVERALTSLRKRLPRLGTWMLADYDARLLVVDVRSDTLLVLCSALFRPRRQVGTRQCVLTVVLSVNDRHCQFLQLLELANVDRPMQRFALNHNALSLSIECRGKLLLPTNPMAQVQSACNAAVFRGQSLTSISAHRLPFSITM